MLTSAGTDGKLNTSAMVMPSGAIRSSGAPCVGGAVGARRHAAQHRRAVVLASARPAQAERVTVAVESGLETLLLENAAHVDAIIAVSAGLMPIGTQSASEAQIASDTLRPLASVVRSARIAAVTAVLQSAWI